MARGRGTGKKSGSKPTSVTRATKQEVRERYAKAREDAQLTGLIPTTPEGSARNNEVVKPSSQEEVAQPQLIAEAIRRGWAVPEESKPLLVDELVDIIYNEGESAKVRVSAFNALRMADQAQHERDNGIKGGTGANMPGSNTNITIHGDVVNNKVQLAGVIRDMISRGELGIIEDEATNSRSIEESEPSDKPSTPGSIGQQRQMETGTPPEIDQ